MADLATTPTPATAAPPPRGPAPSRGRRWSRVLAALAVVVLGVTTSWVAAPGWFVRLAPVGLGFAPGAPASVVEGFHGAAGTYVLGYAHDQYLDVDVTVANAGVLPVTVEEVGLDLPAVPLLVPADASAPGRLAPGEAGAAGLHLRFDHCEAYHEREAMVVEHAVVRVRVLGRTVTEQVRLDRPLMARSPMLWQCPDRTIDRGDDRRSVDGGFSRDVP